MKCLKCKEEVVADQKFCGKCGSQVGRRCAGCGIELKPSDNFCVGCGKPALAEPTEKKDEKERRVIDVNDAPSAYREKITDPKRLKTKRERKKVAIVFADVVGYTSMSETLSPEEVHTIINSYFKDLTEVVFTYEGIVDKYIGDCIMALFGAPIGHEDDPERAVLSCLDMLTLIEKKNRETGLALNLRMGVNYGTVIAGHIGHDLRFEYTVIGDTVNTAQRLESRSIPGRILCSKPIMQHCDHAIAFEDAGEFELKGKRNPVPCFFALGPKQKEASVFHFRGRKLLPLIGRSRELAAMQDCFARVKNGGGRIMAVCSEAGGGKTRLLYELKRIFLADKVRFHWLEGCCYSYFKHRSNYLFERLLLSLTRDVILERKESKIAKIQAKLKEYALSSGDAFRLEGAIGHCFEDLSFSYVVGRQRTDFLSGFIVYLFTELAAKEPLVILLDNLHDIDPTSQILLDNIATIIPAHPIVLFLTFRPPYAPVWSGMPEFLQLNLAPFSEDESKSFIVSLLGDKPVKPRAAEMLHRKTSGNPLFIEEIILQLPDRVKQTTAPLMTKDLDILDLPDTVVGVIGARIDRFDEEALLLLKHASIVGKTFEKAIVDTLSTDLDPNRIAELCVDLVGKDVLAKIGEDSEERFEFRHGLIHEVIYARILDDERRRLHLAVAEAIAERSKIDLSPHYAILAHHYEQGKDKEKAFHFHYLLCKQALSTGELKITGYYLKKAFDDLGGLGEPPSSERILDCKLIGLMTHSLEGNVHCCNELISEIEKAVLGGKNERHKAILYYERAKLAENGGDYAKAIDLLSHARTAIEDAKDPDFALEIQRQQAIVLRRMKEYERAQVIIEDGLATAAALKRHDKEAKFLLEAAIVQQVCNKLGEALQCYKRSFAIRKQLRDKRAMAVILEDIGTLHYEMKQYRKAIDNCARAYDLCKEIGDQAGLVVNLHNRGEIWLRLKEYDEARKLVHESLRRSKECGYPLITIQNLYLLARISAAMGWSHETLKTLHEGLALARDGQHEDLIAAGQTLFITLLGKSVEAGTIPGIMP